MKLLAGGCGGRICHDLTHGILGICAVGNPGAGMAWPFGGKRSRQTGQRGQRREWGEDRTEQRIALEPFCYCHMCTPVPVLNTRNLLQSRVSPALVPWMLRLGVDADERCGMRPASATAPGHRAACSAQAPVAAGMPRQRPGSAPAVFCSAPVASSAASTGSWSVELFRCAGLAGGAGVDGVVGHVVVQQVQQQRLGLPTCVNR